MVQEIENAVSKGNWDLATTLLEKNEEPLVGSILSLTFSGFDFGGSPPPLKLLRHLFRHIPPSNRSKSFADANADMIRRGLRTGFEFFHESFSSVSKTVKNIHTWLTTSLQTFDGTTASGVRLNYQKYQAWGLTLQEAARMYVQLDDVKSLIALSLVWPDENLIASSKRATRYLLHTFQNSKGTVYDLESFMNSVIPNLPPSTPASLSQDYLVCLYGFKCDDLGDCTWPNCEDVISNFFKITEDFSGSGKVRSWKVLECILVQIKKVYYSNSRNEVITSLLENLKDFESLCHQTLSLESGPMRLNLDKTITHLKDILSSVSFIVDDAGRKDSAEWQSKGFSDLEFHLEDPVREDKYSEVQDLFVSSLESLKRSAKVLALQIIQDYENKADEKLEEFKEYVSNLKSEITNTSNDSLGLGSVDLTSPNDLWNSRIRTPSIHNRERRYLVELRSDPLSSSSRLKKLHDLFSRFDEIDYQFEGFDDTANMKEGLSIILEQTRANNKFRHDLVEDLSFTSREWKEKKANLVSKLEGIWKTSVADVIDSFTKKIQGSYADCVSDGINFDKFVTSCYTSLDTMKSLLSEELVDLNYHEDFMKDVIEGERMEDKQVKLEEVRQRYDHANDRFDHLRDEDGVDEIIHDWIRLNSEMTGELCRIERSAEICNQAEEWFSEVEGFYLRVKTEVQTAFSKVLKGIVETRLERFEVKRHTGKMKRLKWEKEWEEQINDMDETNESAYKEMEEDLKGTEKSIQGLGEYSKKEEEWERKVKFGRERCKRQVESAEANKKKCEVDLSEANDEFDFRVDAFLTAEREEKLYEESLGEGGSVAETMRRSKEHLEKSVEKSLQGGLLIEAKYNLEIAQDKLKLAEDRLEFILDVSVVLLERAIDYEQVRIGMRHELELVAADLKKDEVEKEELTLRSATEEEIRQEKSWLTGECERLEESVKDAALAVVQEFTEERRNKFYEVGKTIKREFQKLVPEFRIKQNNARYEMVDQKNGVDLDQLKLLLDEAQKDLKEAGVERFKCCEIVDSIGMEATAAQGWAGDFGEDQGYEEMEVGDSDEDDLDGDEWQKRVEAKMRRQTTAPPKNHASIMTSTEEKEKARREKKNQEQKERIAALGFLLEVEQIYGMAQTDELNSLLKKEEAEAKLKEIDFVFERKTAAYDDAISYLEEKELNLELFADDQWKRKFEASKRRDSKKIREAEESRARKEDRIYQSFKCANVSDATEVSAGSKVKCDGTTLYSLDVSNIPGGVAFALHVLKVSDDIVELMVRVNGRDLAEDTLKVNSYLTNCPAVEGDVKVLFTIDGTNDALKVAKYGETNLEFLLSGKPFADVHVKAIPGEEWLLPNTLNFVDGTNDNSIFPKSIKVTYPDGSSGMDGGIDQEGNYTFGNLLFTMRDGPVRIEIGAEGFRVRSLVFYKCGALRRKVKVMKVCLDPGEDEDEAFFNGSLYTSHRFMLTWDVTSDMNIYVIRSDGVKVDFERKNSGANVEGYGGIKGQSKVSKRASMAHEMTKRNGSGHGPETVSVLARTGMDYVIYVKSHSAEVPISESCAFVEHNFTDGSKGYRVPKVLKASGECWMVCKIYGDGKVFEIGEVEEDEPEVVNGEIVTNGVWDESS
ncbi:hypothetical protein TrST_g12699 [Triparma strigata]|uniref:Uncharacterized protein n=1 Tax=Triparma strigata TaxID=1606541 RepID=A0A9W7BY20_9STRA|nr:hypothetical protein TrST_g12699 [Triparma strigata]